MDRAINDDTSCGLADLVTAGFVESAEIGGFTSVRGSVALICETRVRVWAFQRNELAATSERRVADKTHAWRNVDSAAIDSLVLATEIGIARKSIRALVIGNSEVAIGDYLVVSVAKRAVARSGNALVVGAVFIAHRTSEIRDHLACPNRANLSVAGPSLA